MNLFIWFLAQNGLSANDWWMDKHWLSKTFSPDTQPKSHKHLLSWVRQNLIIWTFGYEEKVWSLLKKSCCELLTMYFHKLCVPYKMIMFYEGQHSKVAWIIILQRIFISNTICWNYEFIWTFSKHLENLILVVKSFRDTCGLMITKYHSREAHNYLSRSFSKAKTLNPSHCHVIMTFPTKDTKEQYCKVCR